MRSTSSLLCSALVLALFAACGDDSPSNDQDPGDPAGSGGAAGSGDDAGSSGGGLSGQAGTGGVPGGTGGTGGSGGAGGAGGAGGVVVPGKIWPACAAPIPDSGDFAPTKAARLFAGNVSPIGVTADDYVVYRDGAKAMAARLDAAGEPSLISESAGTALFKGSVVFFWSNFDYTAGEADLLAWTGPDCARPLGRTLSSDDTVAASADGSMLLFATNVTPTTVDLEVTARDLSWRHILLPGVGRATNATCRPRYGFAGGRVVVSHCAPGALEASIDTFEGGATGWQKIDVAEQAQVWSADAAGEHVFYTTSGGQARFWAGQDAGVIDDGVTGGLLLPDASAVLYTVGNQLRRSVLPPNGEPTPIVTNKFNRAQRWSPDYSTVLYSSQSTYEGGERFDLLLTPTATFNQSPRKLVTTVDAALSRDAFSADGKFAAYLTGVSAGAGTLHLHAVASGQERTLPGVGTVAAGREGMFVFSSDLSGPNVYPVAASISVVNAATAAAPQPIAAKALGHGNFFVTPGGRAVVYQRPADPQQADAEGLWVAPLP
jgi:hypothetical protein